MAKYCLPLYSTHLTFRRLRRCNALSLSPAICRFKAATHRSRSSAVSAKTMSALAFVMTWNACTLVGRLVTLDSAISTMRPLGLKSPCLERYVMTWSSRVNHRRFQLTPPFFVKKPSKRMAGTRAPPPAPAESILTVAERLSCDCEGEPPEERLLPTRGILYPRIETWFRLSFVLWTRQEAAHFLKKQNLKILKFDLGKIEIPVCFSLLLLVFSQGQGVLVTLHQTCLSSPRSHRGESEQGSRMSEGNTN